MSFPDAQVSREKLEEAAKFFEELRALKPPTSLKEFWPWLDSGFEISGEITNAALLHYSEDARKEDRQRVISVKQVLKVLSILEERLVQEQVDDAFDIYWSKLRGHYNAGSWIIEHFPDIWNGFFQAAKYLFDVAIGRAEFPDIDKIRLQISALFLWQASLAITTGTFAKTAIKCFDTQHDLCDAMRRGALPQPKAKRVRKKRMSR